MKRVVSLMWVASSSSAAISSAIPGAILACLLLVSAAMVPAFAADAVALPKPDAVKGGQLYEQGDAARGIIACASCHGAAGNSAMPANPSLAGQPHEYLAKQLRDFKIKEGATMPARMGPGGNPTIMTANVANLTEADMLNMALYLSTQAVKEPATAGYADLKPLGQKIWRGGLPERNVAACAACHGARGEGIPGQYPRLAGQFPSYIEEQLKLFRSGDRKTSVPMHDLADRMSDADIRAVSDYAAGLR
ncbi:MAG: c-type cytochrome [Comamonadaceae bacterium]|nr:MAG: c-type cytochrome [Comamonadaceae bacterium]